MSSSVLLRRSAREDSPDSCDRTRDTPPEDGPSFTTLPLSVRWPVDLDESESPELDEGPAGCLVGLAARLLLLLLLLEVLEGLRVERRSICRLSANQRSSEMVQERCGRRERGTSSNLGLLVELLLKVGVWGRVPAEELSSAASCW